MRRTLLIALVAVLLTVTQAGVAFAGETASVDLHVSVAVPPPPPPVSGGGGGGDAPDFGRTASDGKLSVSVPAGTVVRNASGNIIPSYLVQISLTTNLPSPPENSSVIGLAYDLQPSGATFNPPIPITFAYDPDQIPEGVSETGLAIAFWDGAQWVELGSVVDVTERTITAYVSHFTVFAVLATVIPVMPEPVPALPSLEPEPVPSPKEPDVVITIPPFSPKSPDVVVPIPLVTPSPTPIPEPLLPLDSKMGGSGMWFWLVLVVSAAFIGYITWVTVRWWRLHRVRR